MNTAGAIPMSDALAYFLTWPTYGTWLPGDQRGWVEYHHGWQMPDAIRELEARAKMTEDACRLTAAERKIVEKQIAETCRHRGWALLAVNCRSNHLHVVIAATRSLFPRKVRVDLKAWCTRALREQSNAERLHWWAERGSQRVIFDEESLQRVLSYVLDVQERQGRGLDSLSDIDDASG